MAMVANGLDFGPAVENVRTGHHGFVVHVSHTLAVAVRAGDALEYVVGCHRLVPKVHMTDYAQLIARRHIEHFR